MTTNRNDGMSVIIPARNEALAGWTIRNLCRTTDIPLDIILVDDGSDAIDYGAEVEALMSTVRAAGSSLTLLRREQYAGNGPSRDWGIESAAFDCCCILDAHCDFPEMNWASRALAWQTSHPQSIGCSVSVKLNDDIKSCSDPRAKAEYWGAWIEPTQITSGGEYRIMQGVWSRNLDYRRNLGYDVEPGGRTTGKPDPIYAPIEIGCIMGGCYFLTRDHYLGALHRIWGRLRTWGSSEPAICLVQWMAGHSCYLLPIECGHVYRTGKQNLVPWTHRPHDIIYNQIVVAAIAYHGHPREFEAAMAHLAIKKRAPFNHALDLAIAKGIFQFASKIYQSSSRTWQQHIEKWNEKK